MYNKNFIGLEGFIWFMGVVENRDDPLKLGRVQARAFGWHTNDKINIPTKDLPWAQPLIPTNSSTTSYAPKEGDMIVGFFTDGESAQAPVFMGVLPGIPEVTPPLKSGFSDAREQVNLDGAPTKPYAREIIDTGVKLKLYPKTRYPKTEDLNQPTTSRLARHEDLANTIYQFRKDNIAKVSSTDGTTWTEPNPPYNAQYPFNNVTESESGHIFEIDDTNLNERIMLAHRTGTTLEMFPSGTKLNKIVKDNYSITYGSNFCYVKGKTELTVENVSKIRIKGHTTIEIDSDLDFRVAGNMNLSVGKDLNIQTGGGMNYNIKGDVNEYVRGARHNQTIGKYDVSSSGQISFDGKTINLNSGTSAGAKQIKLTDPNSYTNPSEIKVTPEIVSTVNYKPL